MSVVNDEFSLTKKELAKDIIGEIVLAEAPEGILKKWRNIFKISQKELSDELGITSSVVSDYELGRRKSPGIKLINRYVIAMIDIDSRKGGSVIKSFMRTGKNPPLSDSIIDIKEFTKNMSVHDFCEHTNSVMLVGKNRQAEEIYGYTIIDSLKAITQLSFSELIKLYGITTQRALIFTQVSTGRSPMVALKLTNLHPALVIFHGLNQVDDIAKRIAEAENIPLAVCKMERVEDIVERLKQLK
ncbi:MAG: helix-turn-helix domain-containing protein [Candidatus Aenigmatarchaeota archaeon]